MTCIRVKESSDGEISFIGIRWPLVGLLNLLFSNKYNIRFVPHAIINHRFAGGDDNWLPDAIYRQIVKSTWGIGLPLAGHSLMRAPADVNNVCFLRCVFALHNSMMEQAVHRGWDWMMTLPLQPVLFGGYKVHQYRVPLLIFSGILIGCIILHPPEVVFL